MSTDFDREDRVISEVLKSFGPWKNNIVIGGGYALIIYKLYLADKLVGNPPVGTRDIDSLIRRKLPEQSPKNIAQHLKEAGFTHAYKDRETPPTESYAKEIEGVEIEVEFLTDNRARKNHQNVSIAGIVAQPLRFLEMSLEKTIEFTTFSNESGLVVAPGAWMFHKGLTFTKRKSELKKLKDLYGLWYAASQLGVFSCQAITELQVLASACTRYKTFRKNLDTWIENASRRNWIELEAQDPYGVLKEPHFKRVVNDLIKEQTQNKKNSFSSEVATLGDIIAELKGEKLLEKFHQALGAGADVNDVSRNGHRPLQMTLKKRHPVAVAKKLIEHGADLISRDRSGQTPLQAAINNGVFEIANLLIAKGVPFSEHNSFLEYNSRMFYKFLLYRRR